MQKIRSGALALLRVGIAFLVASIGLAIGFGIAIVISGRMVYALGLLGAAVALLLGLVLLLLWRRTGVVLEDGGIRWTPVFGASSYQPWENIARVHVPGDEDPERCVRLMLRDGSAADVRPISKPQDATDQRRATPGYLAAAEKIVQAHRSRAAGRCPRGIRMIVRTQSSTALMWAGVILLLAAFSTCLFGVVELLLQRHVSSGLVWFTIGAGVGLLGVVLVVVGWRSHAVITADGVRWNTGLGGVTRIGWAQVAQVQIPGRGEPGARSGCVCTTASWCP